MSTTTTYKPGTIVLDNDADALRIVESEPHGHTVEYRGDRFWVADDTIDHDARVHLTISRDATYVDQGAPWFVTSETPDPDGDHTWGHFPTHADAVAFADAVNAR